MLPPRAASVTGRGDDPQRPPVVLVGLASVIGLQTARLLHDRGIRVIGLAGDPGHYAARTRTCERVLAADVHGPGFLEVLEVLGEELAEELADARAAGLPGPVLLPCTDRAVLVVAQHAAALRRWFEVPLSGFDTVHALTDKAAFADLIDRVGLQGPATRVVRDAADVEIAAGLRFPVVVKPSVKSHHWRTVTRSKVCRVEDPTGLRELCARVGRAAGALVVQELVDGDEDRLITCNSYVDRHGRTLASFTSRKRRQWPPALGIASYAEPVEDAEVAALAERLFADAGFHGLAYLEVKRDRASGRPVLIEANVGRPTGRSAMAEASGVELLMTMYADAVGLPLPPAAERRQAPGGPAWINLRRDALAFWAARRAGAMTAREWSQDLRRPLVHAVWSRRDPMPFIMELCHSSRRAWTRTTGRRATSPRPAAPLPLPPSRTPDVTVRRAAE
ncbi:hypothetical protein KLP28_08270 [Nocardioidaceae bacterium]|nr:hypothetical protein KLP28_08270 [Nocardioidaceae bacterium]